MRITKSIIQENFKGRSKKEECMDTKYFKRIIAFIIVLSMIFTTTAMAMPYGQAKKMLKNKPGWEYVQKYVKRKGIMKGFPDGKFYENLYVKRADAVVMIDRAFKLSALIDMLDRDYKDIFDDVDKNEYYFDAIYKICEELFYEQNPESNIQFEVIDSVSMSHGSGWLIMKCAMLIENGYTFEELIEYCETIKYRIKHFLSVDDLDSLIRSGRLSNASGVIGKLLNVKPIMSMKNTKGAVAAKKRGIKQVYNYYIQEFLNRVDYEQTNFVIVGYTSDINKAENLKALLLEAGFKGDIYIMQMGVAVGTHVGLGGLSMFFVEKPHEDFKQHMKDKILKYIHS
jgi:fatty acid-binding protein DegV